MVFNDLEFFFLDFLEIFRAFLLDPLEFFGRRIVFPGLLPVGLFGDLRRLPVKGDLALVRLQHPGGFFFQRGDLVIHGLFQHLPLEGFHLVVHGHVFGGTLGGEGELRLPEFQFRRFGLRKPHLVHAVLLVPLVLPLLHAGFVGFAAAGFRGCRRRIARTHDHWGSLKSGFHLRRFCVDLRRHGLNGSGHPFVLGQNDVGGLLRLVGGAVQRIHDSRRRGFDRRLRRIHPGQQPGNIRAHRYLDLVVRHINPSEMLIPIRCLPEIEA